MTWVRLICGIRHGQDSVVFSLKPSFDLAKPETLECGPCKPKPPEADLANWRFREAAAVGDGTWSHAPHASRASRWNQKIPVGRLNGRKREIKRNKQENWWYGTTVLETCKG